MLEPRNRRLLLESLRPPPGYALDCAVGTTFSLDLLALLTVPLAFTFFGWEDDADGKAENPLALLEAVRRHADRMSIFCQAGQIFIPKHHQLLFAHLEQSVFEVKPREPRRVFHPKVWVLRLCSPSEPVLYRLLVLSRNLTFDRSWDVMLVLDGQVTDRKKAFAKNHPLGDFVAALPDLAVRPVPRRIRSDIERVQAELRRVRFELPEGFEEVRFWPLGLGGSPSWPFGGRVDRMLVISPFVSESCLTRLTESGEDHVLVSRLESLDVLDQGCLDPFSSVRVLSDGAHPEPLDDIEEGDESGDTDSKGASEASTSLAGLHAKTYIADAGWKARLWTGSANATDAAFHGNVEFLVELVGRKGRCGVDAVLGQTEDNVSLADLLQEYSPPVEAPPRDPVQERLEARVYATRRLLAEAGLVATVAPVEGEDEYRLSLRVPERLPLEIPPEVRARCWPITLKEAAAVTVPGGPQDRPEARVLATFGPISFEALTSFFAFDLHSAEDSRTASARFVLNLPMEGTPKDRRQRILLSILQNRDQVLRYLLLLLAEGGLDPRAALDLTRAVTGGDSEDRGGSAGLPLLEALVRALHRSPEKLDQIARLVDDLNETPEGRELLPKDFEAIWQPIWSVRKGLKP